MPEPLCGAPLDLERQMPKLSRRTVIRDALVGAATTVAAGIGPARAAAAPKTFVLVHGAGGGGWQWRKVVDLLEQRGCKAFAPTLTGLGERSHLLSKAVGLDTHVTDVVNVVKWEGLEQVCLVAHSYAGWPCGAAVDQIGDKIASIVWLDAFAPQNNRSLADLIGEPLRRFLDDAAARGELGMPLPARLSPASINPRDEALVISKLTPQPIATYAQPLRYAGGLVKVAKKTYVRLPDFSNPLFDSAYAESKRDPAWSAVAFDRCGHFAMFDAPERLADLLIQAA